MLCLNVEARDITIRKDKAMSAEVVIIINSQYTKYNNYKLESCL